MESGNTTRQEAREERRARIRLVVGWTTILITLLFLTMMFGYVAFSAMLKE